MAGDKRIDGRNNQPMRVYAPNSGSLALKEEYAYYGTRLAETRPQRSEPTPIKPQPSRRTPPKKAHVPLSQILRQNKVGVKLLALACVATVAFTALFVVLRFATISSAQRELNSLDNEIANTNKMLEEVNRDYLFSLDIAAARNAAEAAGMMHSISVNPVHP